MAIENWHDISVAEIIAKVPASAASNHCFWGICDVGYLGAGKFGW